MDKDILTPSAIPCLFDADLSQLSLDQLQSGIGYGRDLNLEEIVGLTALHWAPRVFHGFYYVGDKGYCLHADDAMRYIPRQAGATVLNLPFSPLEGEPLSVITYFRDDDGRICVGRRWRQKVHFTGTIAIGDTEAHEQIDLSEMGEIISYNLANADLSRAEFILRHYPDCTTRVQLPADLGETGPGVVQIELDPPAITALPFEFTNKALFQKQVEDWPAQPGEWSLNYNGTLLYAYLEEVPIEPGYLTYHHTYPADLLFTQSYVVDHGEITDPQTLETTEIVGVSDGSANLCFPCRYFPILSVADSNIFVDDSGVVSEWTIVADLSGYGANDEVCTLDIDLGLIRFGDGTNGKIPAEDSRVGIIYASVPLIQYEARRDKIVTGKEVNLHPLMTPVHRGFIYLSHKTDILHALTLTCDKDEISGDVFGPLYCGNDYTTLTCLATNPQGDPIVDLPVEFVIGDYGYFNLLPTGVNVRISTLADGLCQTVFHPPGNIIQLAEVVELYDQDENFLDPYQTITNPDDAIDITPGDLGGTDYYDEALTFLLVDDDPLLPYSPTRRQGGSLVLLYHFDESSNNFIPTHPEEVAGVSYLKYPYSLPTPSDLSQLRKFVVAIPKIVTLYCKATDPLSGREIQSNTLTLLIKAPPFQIGPYTVKIIGEQTAGSAVGAATYLTIDRRGGLNAFFVISS